MGTNKLVSFGLLLSSLVGFPRRRDFPLMQGKDLSRKCTRNGSRTGFVCRPFMTLNFSQGWLATRVLLRSLFFSMALISVPILYLIYQGNVCSGMGSGDDCVLFTEQATMPTSLLSVPSLKTNEELSITQPHHNTVSYEEYLQLQLKRTQYLKLKNLWTTRAWRQKVQAFSDVFQGLLDERLLRHGDKVLCVGARAGEEVMAMQEIGVQDTIGIDVIDSPPLVRKGDVHKQPFPNATFDFEFSHVFDTSTSPDLFVAEIERTLKPGGLAAMLVSLAKWRDKILMNGLHVDPVTLLFNESNIVYVTKAEVSGLDTLIVFRKCCPSGEEENVNHDTNLHQNWNCSVSKPNSVVMQQLESLIMEEPRESWIASRTHATNLKYLPNVRGIDHISRYVYIDIGARDIGSSIGSWFMEYYPKSNNRFDIFAIEMDRSFESSYTYHPEVKFLPYAAWIRNESLFLKAKSFADGSPPGGSIQNHESMSAGTSGREPAVNVVKVDGLDFADWLKHTFSVDDFIVVKMDVGGMEFELLPTLLESGAMCLIDELFLECHYHRMEVITEGMPDYKKNYEECVALYMMLRDKGVVAHQWWW